MATNNAQTVEDLKKQLRLFADVEKATLLQRFFKTGKGEYGEGDIFLGVMVPYTRKVAKKFTDLTLSEIKELLYSRIHEERLCAFILLEQKYRKADEAGKKIVFDFYIKNAKQANSWDLVDLFAPKIVGDYLMDKNKSPSQIKSQFDGVNILYKFAVSKNLWEKRIAILSTFMFIKYHKYKDSFKIAEILLNDKHDLIHKAIGWMLREIGKRDLSEEEKFLKKYYKKMPRTMLRYAIEKFPEEKRVKYLAKQNTEF